MGRDERSTRVSSSSRRFVVSMNMWRCRMQCTAMAKKSTATTPKKTSAAGDAEGNGESRVETKSSCGRIRQESGKGEKTSAESPRVACTEKYGRSARTGRDTEQTR